MRNLKYSISIDHKLHTVYIHTILVKNVALERGVSHKSFVTILTYSYINAYDYTFYDFKIVNSYCTYKLLQCINKFREFSRGAGDRSWVRFPLLFPWYYYFLAVASRQSVASSSATQHAMPPEFGRKWGTENVNNISIVNIT